VDQKLLFWYCKDTVVKINLHSSEIIHKIKPQISWICGQSETPKVRLRLFGRWEKRFIAHRHTEAVLISKPSRCSTLVSHALLVRCVSVCTVHLSPCNFIHLFHGSSAHNWPPSPATYKLLFFCSVCIGVRQTYQIITISLFCRELKKNGTPDGKCINSRGVTPLATQTAEPASRSSPMLLAVALIFEWAALLGSQTVLSKAQHNAHHTGETYQF
jgi:hypothetical protein